TGAPFAVWRRCTLLRRNLGWNRRRGRLRLRPGSKDLGGLLVVETKTFEVAQEGAVERRDPWVTAPLRVMLPRNGPGCRTSVCGLPNDQDGSAGGEAAPILTATVVSTGLPVEVGIHVERAFGRGELRHLSGVDACFRRAI